MEDPSRAVWLIPTRQFQPARLEARERSPGARLEDVDIRVGAAADRPVYAAGHG